MISIPRRALLITAFVLVAGLLTQIKMPRAANIGQFGPAKEITGIEHWINSEPLTLANLKGKVVLVHFWTFGCYNCVNTLPHVTKWYDTYKKDGFVVIGVHAPEFPNERSTKNVEAAVKRFGIHYPVAQDNAFSTWKAYNNQYWPAMYLIDKAGHVVLEHAGEGAYEETERTIAKLLG